METKECLNRVVLLYQKLFNLYYELVSTQSFFTVFLKNSAMLDHKFHHTVNLKDNNSKKRIRSYKFG